MKRTLLLSTLALTCLIGRGVAAAAWEPNTGDLDSAVKAGEFGGYFEKLTEWLRRKAPADAHRISAEPLKALVEEPVFRNTLFQRQFIAKHGVEPLDAFARANAGNRAFLAWLLPNTEALRLYLESVVPLGREAREENRYVLPAAILERWQHIFHADSESREGLYLKLAMATAVAPPGSGDPGAGQKQPPETPLDRYRHFKAAHRNGELFPSFDHLSVWEYQKVVQSGASNADLAWAREMINTWRPDLRENEMVVNSTSQVWYRNSPHPFTDYRSVLSGGGKCGPRSSWSIMICQAFGIPATGVRQPGHVCVAYKTAYPETEPQPGSAWKVGYGRGWHVSRVHGLSGPDFLAAMEERARAAQFSQVENLRWLASALDSGEHAAAVMEVAHAIQKSVPAIETDHTASLRAEEAELEVAPEVETTEASTPDGPIELAPGTTRIDAAAFSRASGVLVPDCYTGGKQVNFQAWVEKGEVEYILDVSAAGMYNIVLHVAAPNYDQVLQVASGNNEPVTIDVPNTTGLWGTTEAVAIRLGKGEQTLKLSAPSQRGVAVHLFELTSQ